MREQGSSTLMADESGWVMDRLAGLQEIVSPEQIQQALSVTSKVNGRACPLTHEVMLWVVLAMGLLTHVPIRQVFKLCRRMHAHEKTPARSSLCVARQRLGIEPIRQLHKDVVRLLAKPETPGAFYKGLRLMGIDGTILDVPDSEANAAVFHRASNAQGSGGFPQVRKVSLFELGTHVEFAFAADGFQVGEQTLAARLWDHIPADVLLLEDRGFFAFDAWKKLDSRKIKLLMRLKNNLIVTCFQRLADGSYLSKIYPSDYSRKKDRDGIVVRLIEYTLNDPQRVGHNQKHRLLTNLLDPELYPAEELIIGYHSRWEVELVFDEQKTHQDPIRATKTAHLRSETPEGVYQELYAISLGHFVVRALMFEAAESEGLDPVRLSFTGCFHILQCRLPECRSHTSTSFHEWYVRLLEELRQEIIPLRRNRINPRVIKRKISKWDKKREIHKKPPPLTKRFAQCIVMLS